MQDTVTSADFGPSVHLVPADHGGAGDEVIVVCEHASRKIPDVLGALGLTEEERASHIAWDPGALPVASQLAEDLGASLVHGGLSRLVYDCNRPPTAASAVPETSAGIAIPGNSGLSPTQRAVRVEQVYGPFHDMLAQQIAAMQPGLRLLVTVHSFTPVYMGQARSVEIGLLHGEDPRFAHAMMAQVPEVESFDVRLNEPYSARDGVAHTLDVHGTANGLDSVMIEVRSDLIGSDTEQAGMAHHLAGWISRTRRSLHRGDAA